MLFSNVHHAFAVEVKCGKIIGDWFLSIEEVKFLILFINLFLYIYENRRLLWITAYMVKNEAVSLPWNNIEYSFTIYE